MKKLLSVIIIVLALFISVNGQSTHFFSDNPTFVDTDYIEGTLSNVSSTKSFPVYGALTSALDNEDITDCADLFYAYNDLGEGDENDGILLYVDPDIREYSIYAHGFGTDVFDDDALIYIENAIYPYLSDSEYENAFIAFSDACDYILTSYENGTPYKAPFEWLTVLIITGIIGLIVGLISVSVMKGNMKSVRFNDSARQYAINDSFTLNHSRDIFLYRTITRVRKPESNSSGGVRSSASGGSFRARSGKF